VKSGKGLLALYFDDGFARARGQALLVDGKLVDEE